jgi:hypothetical protein
MSSPRHLLRRIATALLDHAASIMPSHRSAWAEAMKREIHHIERDREALTWALGAVVAGYLERTRLSSAIQAPGVRLFLALFICAQAADQMFATALTLAYRLHATGLAGFLGRLTPGDDFRRFIPLMDATPWWLHAVWIASCILCLVAAGDLLGNRRSAFPAFCAAWIAGVAGAILSHASPEYRTAFSFPASHVVRDLLIPAARTLAPAVVAVALWIHRRGISVAEIEAA